MNRILLLVTAFLTSVFVSYGQDSYSKRADKLHDKILSVDTHTDAPLVLCHPEKNKAAQITAANMKAGRLDAAVFALYHGKSTRDSVGRKKALDYFLSEYDLLQKYMSHHQDEFRLAKSSDDLLRIKKDGKSAYIIGMENGSQLGYDLANVEKFYNLGLRIITLCHNYSNDLCDSSKDDAIWGGLSDYGEKVVAEMNRLGIIVDVSHAASATVYDCAKVSKTPIIASHSCAYAIKANSRNLKDDEMRAIASTGGLVQVTTYTGFLSYLPKKDVGIKAICDHIEHVRKVVGIDHVGIGTDFDGGGGVVNMEDASKMKNISIELMRRGWSDSDLEKFWGGNFLRVLRQIEEYALQNR